MTTIEKVEIYFEPQGMVKTMMNSGAQVGIPLDQAIPEAIRTADEFLGMSGNLISYHSNHSLSVQTTDEKSDAEWAQFIGPKCSPDTEWKRWIGETTQGRWNVVVFGINKTVTT